ncbi:hypothetical protein MPSEU_001102200 [Mayamaea pseudoterrestris]|nr:hypothetical protein MPSEU_001102200 [Mayamaea pseudoterrestris]
MTFAVSNKSLLICTFLIATSSKILLFPSYYSTDFLVHRHWKAVTKHLPMSEWYFDDVYVSTKHTLDYPPGFAFLESAFANNYVTRTLLQRFILDETCLELLNDNELKDSISNRCVAFMRSTVIVGDLVLWLGAGTMAVAVESSEASMSMPGFLFTVLNPGLIWLDHVHFQYNGLLLGVLFLSVACLLQANKLELRCGKPTAASDIYQLVGAALFAILLTLKHLYLTLALWYFAYLLRRFCFVQNKFSIERLLLLGVGTLHCLMTPFLPLLMTSPQPTLLVKQIASRLFPFGRGLVHDYWAGNVWAVYKAIDKVFAKLFQASLPDVSPFIVGMIMLLFLMIGAKAAWMAAAQRDNHLLLLSLAYSAMVSFLTAYHVHEKAIMTTLVLLTFLAALDKQYTLLLWESTAWGLLGLFPLLFEPREFLLKLTSYMAYMAALYAFVGRTSNTEKAWVGVSLVGVFAVIVMLEGLPISFWGRMEFAPLAVTSLACAAGLIQCFARLTTNMLIYCSVHDVVANATATSIKDFSIAVKPDEIDDVDYIPPVRVVKDNDDDQYAYLLSTKEMQQIAELIIPKGITYCPWRRLYRLSRDGDSFAAFMECVKGQSRTLIVIRTTKGSLLGAFADAEWQNAPQFVGGPSACLYKMYDGTVIPYKWSGVNRFVQLCDANNQRIAFGGGSDDLGQTAFGLVIERHFQIGTTGHCVTFNNEPLCDETIFAIEDLEVFGFLVGTF